MKNQNLQSIEVQLKELLEREKKDWTKTAQLLIEIERSKLFEAKAKSFTQYVRLLASQFKIHESNFWRIKKAGEYYLKLNDTTNIEVISEAKTTPEQVEILNKISTIAPLEVVKTLEKKMVNGETTRQELREVWQAYRPGKKGKTERGRGLKTNNESIAVGITTGDIGAALKSSKWVIDTLESDFEYIHHFNEVAVITGTSRHARRIDAVAMVKESFKSSLPTVIGVEIKSNINDLERDKKFSEYLPFCHYFYLAVPNEPDFINAANNLITPEIGLLVVTNEVVEGKYQVIVNRKSSRLQPSPAILSEIYGKCLIYSLGWSGKGKKD